MLLVDANYRIREIRIAMGTSAPCDERIQLSVDEGNVFSAEGIAGGETAHPRWQVIDDGSSGAVRFDARDASGRATVIRSYRRYDIGATWWSWVCASEACF